MRLFPFICENNTKRATLHWLTSVWTEKIQIKGQNSLELSETDRNKGETVTRTDKKDPKTTEWVCLIAHCSSDEWGKVTRLLVTQEKQQLNKLKKIHIEKQKTFVFLPKRKRAP